MNFYELFEDTLDNLKDKQVIEKKAIAALDVSWMKYIRIWRKSDVKKSTYIFQIIIKNYESDEESLAFLTICYCLE